MKDVADTIVGAGAAVTKGEPVHEALEQRSNIIAMTEQVHDAALTPVEPGGLSHGERAALAARIAGLGGQEALVAHYRALMEQASASDETAAMADLSSDGGGDRRRAALIAYVNRATISPSDFDASDIEVLKAAGVNDADIVRLAELVAFLAYQIRLVDGLRLMKEFS